MSDWIGDLTVGLGWVYYKGPVGHNDYHQHYAVQICFPFSGPLHIETLETRRIVDEVLVIGSNVSHRLSSQSQSATLLYLEPTLVAQNLARLHIDGVSELAISQTQMDTIHSALDISPENMGSGFGQEIARLIWPQTSGRNVFVPVDPRISQTLATIAALDDLNIRLGQLVQASGLSASRFRHLFSAQIGMSLKSYLLWAKLQRAFGCLATDGSLTNAAHMAGFADSAHLSRTFKRMFGLTPGDINKNARFTTRNSKS